MSNKNLDNMNNIDNELFISLVEEREVLWDKTLEIYKDKRKSLRAWREICEILNENFESLSEVEKNKYGKVIIAKWKNMKDRWMKSHKKMIESKSGSGASSSTFKYMFYENMQFLTKISEHRETESNMQQIPETENSENAKRDCNKYDIIYTPTKSKKMKKEQVLKEKDLNTLDNKLINLIDSLQKEEINKTNDSRALSFFKSITSTVEKFSEEDLIEFQYQVISTIRNIKQKNKNTYCITPTSQASELNHIVLQPNYTQTYSSATQKKLRSYCNPSTSRVLSSPLHPIQPQQTNQNYETQYYGCSDEAGPSNAEKKPSYDSEQIPDNNSQYETSLSSAVDVDFTTLNEH